MRKSFWLATGERYVSLVTNFLTLALVSRLLTPSEIGISVVGGAIVQTVLATREFATTNFIVQKPTLESVDVRTGATIFFAITVIIALVLLLCSGTIGRLYDDERLSLYIKICALCVVFDGAYAPIQALFRRKLSFDILALLGIIGAVISAATTISLAKLGWGYLSFALGWLLASLAVLTIAIWIWKDVTIFKPCLVSWRELLAFGGYSGANIMLFKLYESLPYLVLARTLSVDGVALYNRSAMLSQLPDKMLLGGLATILLPTFSADVREGRSLCQKYLRAIELVTSVQWPALVGLTLLAYPAVDLILGAQWKGVAPLVQVMALASLFSFSSELTHPILMSAGAMRDLFLRGLIIWPVSAILIGFASLWGLEAAAGAWLAIVPLQALISIMILRRHLDVPWLSIILSLRSAAALAGLTSVGPIIVILTNRAGVEMSLGSATIAILLGAFGWSLGLWLMSHPLLREFRAVLSILSRMAGDVSRFKPANWVTRRKKGDVALRQGSGKIV